MMNSLQASLEKMGPLFIVSGFIPSLAFVTFVLFAFDPILPPAIHNRLGNVYNPLSQSGLIMLIIAIVLGFTMTILNNFLIKVFEGYILLGHFPIFKKAEQKRERKMSKKIALVRKLLIPYQEAEKMDRPRAQKLIQILERLEIQYNASFPGSKNEIMPTTFGNILKSAEYYPADRYKINSVPMWPRLIHAIEPSYYSKINDTRNQLSFVVNCSFLLVCFALLSFCAASYQWFLGKLGANGVTDLLYFIPVDLSIKIYSQRALIYIIVGAVSFILAIIFYRASLVTVYEFGDMIRSAYDLFRFDLLKKLHIALPDNSHAERNIWRTINDLMLIGYYWGEQPKFDYLHQETGRSEKVDSLSVEELGK